MAILSLWPYLGTQPDDTFSGLCNVRLTWLLNHTNPESEAPGCPQPAAKTNKTITQNYGVLGHCAGLLCNGLRTALQSSMSSLYHASLNSNSGIATPGPPL